MAPTRTIYCEDALTWMASSPGLETLARASVITSLPDLSEIPELGLAGWQRWFEDAAFAVLRSLGGEGVALFFQSDIRHGGRWIDKSNLVQRAADRSDHCLLFHKIVCRLPAGTPTQGRSSYSHLLAFAQGPRPTLRRPTPDVLPDGGHQPGKKSMGVNACLLACRFVLDETATRTIVDPFCGFGTALAVANALGMDAVGVDRSSRMCRHARQLQLQVPAR